MISYIVTNPNIENREYPDLKINSYVISPKALEKKIIEDVDDNVIDEFLSEFTRELAFKNYPYLRILHDDHIEEEKIKHISKLDLLYINKMIAKYNLKEYSKNLLKIGYFKLLYSIDNNYTYPLNLIRAIWEEQSLYLKFHYMNYYYGILDIKKMNDIYNNSFDPKKMSIDQIKYLLKPSESNINDVLIELLHLRAKYVDCDCLYELPPQEKKFIDYKLLEKEDLYDLIHFFRNMKSNLVYSKNNKKIIILSFDPNI